MSAAIARDSALKWRFLGGIALVDAAWIAVSDFHLVLASMPAPAAAAIMLVLAAAFFRHIRRDAALFVLVDSVAQVIVCFAVCGILSYLALGTSQPFIDRRLSAIDAAMGFDWPGFVGWVQTHPLLDLALSIVYYSSGPQMLVLAFILSCRQEARLRELSGTIMISLVLAIAIAGALPAESAYPYYGPAHPEIVPEIGVGDLFALRDGSLRWLDPTRMEGLISFPSFHAILSLLFIYVARRTRGLLAASIVLNGAILVSTLTAGGHYLADVLAGGLVTALSIALYRAVCKDRRSAAPPQAAEPIGLGSLTPRPAS